MRITIEYMAQLATAAGSSEECRELDATTTLRDLLPQLAAEKGKDFAAMTLAPDGTPHPSLLCFVDERQAHGSDTTPLRDGARVCLATPMAGG